MEPERDVTAEPAIDLSTLDPRRDRTRWDQAVARVAERGLALRRLRRAVLRRGLTALGVSAAAALVLWLMVPRRDGLRGGHTDGPRGAGRGGGELLDWAVRDVAPGEVLMMGAGHAH